MFKRKKHLGKSRVSSSYVMIARRTGCKSMYAALRNDSRIFHLPTIVFSLAMLVACGGGGGGSAAAPSTGGDGVEQDLPAALVTDASVARNLIGGARTPTTALTSTQIQDIFRTRAMSSDTLIASDVSLTAAGTQAADTSVTCTAGSCGSIPVDDVTFTISLDDIGIDTGDRFELTRVVSEYTPVMVNTGVTLAQYRATGRNDDGDVFEYLSYGGWLAESAFSVDMLTINGGSNESLLVGFSYGDASGSRPQVTEINRRARWNGSVVGVHKSSGDVIQGHANIYIKDIDTAHIDVIGFINLRNLTSGAKLVAMRWKDVPIAEDGTFTNTTGGNIDGTFYGAGHTEVGGTFNRRNIIGAFGATRRETQ